MKTKNIIISGVGGQGIILASELLSLAAMEAGFDVKKSEVHGMSQRGGSVVSNVRFGEKVYSPLIEEGTADVILSFEKLETLRWIHFLNPQSGVCIVNDLEIIPVQVSQGKGEYPGDIMKRLEKKATRVYLIDGVKYALQAGNPRTANTVLLGALSNFLPIEPEIWEETIKKRVPPKTIEANLKAFWLGRDLFKD